MGILISVFTVLFIIMSLLLIVLILLQSDKSAGMGILGGSSQSAFGSSTADVITKITAVMVTVFMCASLGLSILESHRSESFRNKVLNAEDKSPVNIEQKDEQKEKKGVPAPLSTPAEKK